MVNYFFVYRLGAAVVVETGNFSLNMFNNIYYNPLCFLQYYNALIPPTLLDHVCVYTYIHEHSNVCTYVCMYVRT